MWIYIIYYIEYLNVTIELIASNMCSLRGIRTLYNLGHLYGSR